jgi:hypothetical protein
MSEINETTRLKARICGSDASAQVETSAFGATPCIYLGSGGRTQEISCAGREMPSGGAVISCATRAKGWSDIRAPVDDGAALQLRGSRIASVALPPVNKGDVS